jgi:hypothetical protein
MLCQRCNVNEAVHDICREMPWEITHTCADCLTPEDTEGLADGPEPEQKTEGENKYAH